jgi:hypothetical protein
MYYRDDRHVSIPGVWNRTSGFTAKRHIIMYGESLGDVTDYLSGNPPKWDYGSAKSNPASDNWDMRAGYDGALKLAKEGWEEGVEMIDMALQVIVPASGRAGRWGYSQSGSSVSVTRFLQGHPRNMRNRTKRTMGSAPVLHLIVNTVASCMITATQMANYGAAIAGIVDRLENSGRRVHLDCVFASRLTDRSCGEVRCSFGWNVKKASEPLDLAEVAFSLAHPAAFRRIGFGMLERTPEEVQTPGYGHCCDGLPCDVPDYTDGTMIVDGVNHEPKRCNSPTDALRFAIEQVNKAAVLAGHATPDQPLVDEEEWLADLRD